MNPAKEALTRAVNKAIENGSPVYTNVEKLNLDAIPYDARRSIANALRAAASKFGDWAETVALPRIAAQFESQKAEALAYAKQFEDC